MNNYKTVTDENGMPIAEHRLVMEKSLGRKLSKREHVHHINGRRDDNRLENLALMDAHDHQMLHASLPSMRYTKKARETKRNGVTCEQIRCPQCGRLFVRKASQHAVFCDKVCSGNYYQHESKKPERNVIQVFRASKNELCAIERGDLDVVDGEVMEHSYY